MQTVSSQEAYLTWRNASGQLHRTDGPAITDVDGCKVWYLNDLLHRTDGPAVERTNGSSSWYLHGRRYSKEAFNKTLKELQCVQL